jgi:predicted MFS family arabinose efflux permease
MPTIFSHSLPHNTQRIKVLCAGIASLILMLGIARFAYTPILPLMQQQAGLGIAEGGWLAAFNYVGYFCGALIAANISDLAKKDRLYRLGLIVALVTTMSLGLTQNFWLWSILRFFSGLSSAAGLLLGSGLVMHWLLRHQLRSELGIHFIGMGAGIFLTALFVYLFSDQISWQQHWFWLTALGVLLAMPAWFWLPKPDTSGYTVGGEKMVDQPPSQKFLQTFMMAYFCAGVGYAVIVTFIVAHVNQIAGQNEYGALTFMIIGLAAAPACIIWDLVARKIGTLNALFLAFILQFFGMLIPILSPGLIWTFVGAGLFGGTFIGIVSLVLTMAGRYFPTRPAKMMGKMTLSYGVAQMAAPAAAGMLAQWSGSYHLSIIIACGIMFVGCWLIYGLRQHEY